ncbi:MAG: Flp pilus assembly protein CpaB [Myxococcaceae bacterium]|nr:Flp pilus assembly protein CpaB [Myxococcaceae bacterium]
MAEETKLKAAKWGTVGFGLIALSCAAIAGWVVFQLIQASSAREEKLVPVVVTLRDIQAAEKVTRDALQVVQMPKSLAPKAALGDIEPLFKNGKTPVASTGILAGEALFEARLADASRGTAMAALVTPGFRGVPVKVDNAVARSGLLYPGARVDVVGTIKNPQTYVATTRLVLENARVLAVEAATDVETYKTPGKKAEGDGLSSSAPPLDAVVTLEVTPDQMEVVLLAQREGRLDLALRNGSDSESVATKGATAARLIGESAQVRAPLGEEEARRHPPLRVARHDVARAPTPAPAPAPVVFSPGK